MKILEDYSKEVGVDFTLEQLIESHRRLRNMNLENQTVRLQELANARIAGEKQGYDIVTNGEYVKVSILKNMSVGEMVDFLKEWED